MGEIVSMEAVKAEREPHTSGKAICMECHHEWIAVVPIGVDLFECPSCHLHRGLRAHACVREGPHWECRCGNGLFYLTPGGIYAVIGHGPVQVDGGLRICCPSCAAWQTWEPGPTVRPVP